MSPEETGTKSTWKKRLGKAARASAAYGVLASGAYGAYQALAPNQEAACQEPAGDDEAGYAYVWSDAEAFSAQTRLLKLVYTAWDEGRARVKNFRKAVDETYEKARVDLGEMFSGEMDETIGSLEILESGAVALTLHYRPAEDSDLSRYSRVRIRYKVGARTVQPGSGRIRLPRILKDVAVTDWQGFDEASGTWKDIPVPAKMQPTARKKSEEEPPGCTYPRWNPQGVKYGFLNRDALRAWYR